MSSVPQGTTGASARESTLALDGSTHRISQAGEVSTVSHYKRCGHQSGGPCTCKPKPLRKGQRVLARALYSSHPNKYRPAVVEIVYKHTAMLNFGDSEEYRGCGEERWIVQHGHIKEG